MMNSRRKDKLFNSVLVAILSLYSLIVFYPFYHIVVNSFNADLVKGYALLFPQRLSLRAYEMVFSTDRILNAMLISVLRVVTGVTYSVFILVCAGYALRKRNLVFRNFYLVFFTIPMFFDGGLIPYFLNLKLFGLINTFWVYILPAAFNFYSLMILMSSFNDLSDSLEESAKMDGASSFRILMRIYFPLCMPAIATIALFRGVGMWNSWFDTLFFTSKPRLMTLAGILFQIIVKSQATKEAVGEKFTDLSLFSTIESIKLATIVVAITPILVFYPFVQRYFVKGIRVGSIKE